jgi:hypothetical protein
VESDTRIAHLRRDHVIARLSFEEANYSMKRPFGLKNLAEYVQYAVFVFNIAHV